MVDVGATDVVVVEAVVQASSASLSRWVATEIDEEETAVTVPTTIEQLWGSWCRCRWPSAAARLTPAAAVASARARAAEARRRVRRESERITGVTSVRVRCG